MEIQKAGRIWKEAGQPSPLFILLWLEPAQPSGSWLNLQPHGNRRTISTEETSGAGVAATPPFSQSILWCFVFFWGGGCFMGRCRPDMIFWAATFSFRQGSLQGRASDAAWLLTESVPKRSTLHSLLLRHSKRFLRRILAQEARKDLAKVPPQHLVFHSGHRLSLESPKMEEAFVILFGTWR